jgi:hypothetical protein
MISVLTLPGSVELRALMIAVHIRRDVKRYQPMKGPGAIRRNYELKRRMRIVVANGLEG